MNKMKYTMAFVLAIFCIFTICEAKQHHKRKNIEFDDSQRFESQEELDEEMETVIENVEHALANIYFYRKDENLIGKYLIEASNWLSWGTKTLKYPNDTMDRAPHTRPDPIDLQQNLELPLQD